VTDPSTKGSNDDVVPCLRNRRRRASGRERSARRRAAGRRHPRPDGPTRARPARGGRRPLRGRPPRAQRSGRHLRRLRGLERGSDGRGRGAVDGRAPGWVRRPRPRHDDELSERGRACRRHDPPRAAQVARRGRAWTSRRRTPTSRRSTRAASSCSSTLARSHPRTLRRRWTVRLITSPPTYRTRSQPARTPARDDEPHVAVCRVQRQLRIERGHAGWRRPWNTGCGHLVGIIATE
jgi:hypothetical protein